MVGGSTCGQQLCGPLNDPLWSDPSCFGRLPVVNSEQIVLSMKKYKMPRYVACNKLFELIFMILILIHFRIRRFIRRFGDPVRWHGGARLSPDDRGDRRRLKAIEGDQRRSKAIEGNRRRSKAIEGD